MPQWPELEPHRPTTTNFPPFPDAMNMQKTTDPALSASATTAPIHVPVADFTVLPGPPNAPFVRRQAFDDGHVWMGVVTTEPGSASPWHHHGEYDTYVYLLAGEGTVEFGEGGTERKTFIADGSVAKVPKGLVHREVNTGSVQNKFLIFRVGEGEPVFPAEP
ncbi:MAG: cupin domain-containing protein [Myxococcales bacterium]|nr:cupin domain-containing protein [Myxococcales bacterium]